MYVLIYIHNKPSWALNEAGWATSSPPRASPASERAGLPCAPLRGLLGGYPKGPARLRCSDGPDGRGGGT